MSAPGRSFSKKKSGSRATKPSHDLLPLQEPESDTIALVNVNPLGNQYMFRLNHLHPTFNNIKLRRAALAAIQQEDFLKAVIGDPDWYKVCPAMFVCGAPLATSAGTVFLECHQKVS